MTLILHLLRKKIVYHLFWWKVICFLTKFEFFEKLKWLQQTNPYILYTHKNCLWDIQTCRVEHLSLSLHFNHKPHLQKSLLMFTILPWLSIQLQQNEQRSVPWEWWGTLMTKFELHWLVIMSFLTDKSAALWRDMGEKRTTMKLEIQRVALTSSLPVICEMPADICQIRLPMTNQTCSVSTSWWILWTLEKWAFQQEGLKPHIWCRVPFISHKNLHVQKSWAKEWLEWTVNN